MEKLILSEDEIVRVCSRLAKEIDSKLDETKNGVPVLVGIMNGALPFLYELVKHIKHPIEIDTIKASSYSGTETTGKVNITKEPDINLEGRDVILVEDIIDTGITMHYLREYVKEKYKPKNLYICILVKRETEKAQYDELADFTGLSTDEQRYIVGFGFDYYGLWRNEPYVFVPSKKDIEEWDKIIEDDKKLHSDLRLK
ncbi:MAG: phosphoribosyltransferase family protein [Candidatus Enterosoma sp.]|nr:phosphoribosyltransferase family protein [Bacilli bacterium]MDY3047471.1 phosphoribosyltransferase family protein [Candidatus Enterosoma sp.]